MLSRLNRGKNRVNLECEVIREFPVYRRENFLCLVSVPYPPIAVTQRQTGIDAVPAFSGIQLGAEFGEQRLLLILHPKLTEDLLEVPQSGLIVVSRRRWVAGLNGRVSTVGMGRVCKTRNLPGICDVRFGPVEECPVEFNTFLRLSFADICSGESLVDEEIPPQLLLRE